MQFEELLSPVLFVAKIGPDAYKDEKRFPNGPSCKVGDFVLVRPNTGTRIKIHGREFRLIHDDSVEAVVEDPRGITKKRPFLRRRSLKRSLASQRLRSSMTLQKRTAGVSLCKSRQTR